jgi:hypothetical protein
MDQNEGSSSGRSGARVLPEVVVRCLQKRAGDKLRPSLWSEGRPKLKLCSPPYRPVSHWEILLNMLSQRWA